MKKLIAFLLFLPVTHSFATFIDEETIPTWAQSAVDIVNEKKIMTGFGDGSFRPKKELNRAEAVTIILRIKGIDLTQIEPRDYFDDVTPDMWHARAVTIASEKGWIKGKSKRVFAPAARINRAEFATIIARSFDLDMDNFEKVLEFRDIPNKAWYTPAIRAMNDNGLIRNPRNLNYFPTKKVTRDEAAWVFAKILTMPRLNGKSKSSNFEKNKKRDARRTAIRPRNFNKFKQGYDIKQKKIRLTAKPNGKTIKMDKNSDWTDLGTVLVTNDLPERAELKSLHFKLRFPVSGTGPASNFIGKIVNDEGTFEKEIHIARTGEFDVTGLSISIPTETSVGFSIALKPDNTQQFYSRPGEGLFSIAHADAFSIGLSKREGSRKNSSIAKKAPIVFDSRELSRIEFDPRITDNQ